MQTTYAQRLKRARTHAGLSQADLARGLQLKPQAVQYLEDENNAARGSRYTGGFAEACGVSATWLESGAGEMLAHQAREPSAPYRVDPSPASIAKAIAALKPELRRAVMHLVSTITASQHAGRTYSLSPAEQRTERSTPRARRRTA